MTKRYLLNAVLGPLSERPTPNNATAGASDTPFGIYIDTDTGDVYEATGSAWKNIGTLAGNGATSISGLTSDDADGIDVTADITAGGNVAATGGVTATRLEIDLPSPLVIQQPTGGNGETWQGVDPNDGGVLILAQSFNSGAGGLPADAALWLQIDASVPSEDYASDTLYLAVAPDLAGIPDYNNAQFSGAQTLASLNASGLTELHFAGLSAALAPNTTNWLLLYIQNSGSQAYPAFLAIDADGTDVATATSTDGGATFSTASHHAVRFSLTLTYPAIIDGPLTVTGLGSFPAGLNEGTGNALGGILAHGEGSGNTVSGDYSHGEGANNRASGDRSHAQNQGNIASGAYSDASGSNTKASGVASQSGGNEGEASGANSVTEGKNNNAAALNSHGMGHRALASLTSELAHASSYVISGDDTHGNAQYSRLVGHVETPDATPAAIALEGGAGTSPIAMIDGQTWQVLAQVSGTRHDTPGTVATYLIKGAVACAAGTARLVGTPTIETWHDAGANAWAATLAVSGNQLQVLVTGAAGATIYWFGVMHIARIADSA